MEGQQVNLFPAVQMYVIDSHARNRIIYTGENLIIFVLIIGHVLMKMSSESVFSVTVNLLKRLENADDNEGKLYSNVIIIHRTAMDI